MGDIISLYELIINTFPGVIGINILSIIGFLLILIKIKIIRHPRYLTRYLVFSLLLLIIINYIFGGLISASDVTILTILIISLLLYVLVGYHAAKSPVGISKIKLKRLGDIIDLGLSFEKEDLFSKKPFYIRDLAENFQYNLLHAKYLISRFDFKGAYEVYNSIEEKTLFPAEQLKVMRKKAYVLYELGDMNRAEQMLEQIEGKDEPNYLMLMAMINEHAGKLENASKYLERALNSINNDEGLLEAMIYNNYGRLRRMEGNILDAINYYRLSANIARRHNNKEIIHASFQGLIHLYLLQEENENFKKYFKEYEDLLDMDLLDDAREYYNLKIEIARQNPEIMNLGKIIIEDYFEVRKRLQNNKKLYFDFSALRMVFSARLNPEVVLEQIYLNQDEYFNMQMPDKYFALKEIEIVLREINYPRINKYAWLFIRIVNYMKKYALSEIEHYITTLKDYEITLRGQMEKEKVGVLSRHIRPYNFQDIYNRMVAIKDIYKKNGMVLDTMIMDLDIADECFAPENLMANKSSPCP